MTNIYCNTRVEDVFKRVELSLRTIHVMRSVSDMYKIKNIGELLKITDKEILKHRLCGQKTIDEIRVHLAPLVLPSRPGRSKLPNDRAGSTLSFRVRGEYRERLREAGRLNGRSLSEEAEHRLMRSLDIDELQQAIEAALDARGIT